MKRKITAVFTAVVMLAVVGCSQGATEDLTGSSFGGDPQAEISGTKEAGESPEEDLASGKGTEQKREKNSESGLNIEERDTTIYFNSMSDSGTIPLYFVDGGEIPYIDVADWAELIEGIADLQELREASDGSQYTLDIKENGDVVTLVREGDAFSMEIDCANDTFHFQDYNAFLRWGDETLVDITTNIKFFNDKGEGEYLQRNEYNNELYGHQVYMDFSEYGIDLLKNDDGYYVPLQTMSDILLAPKAMNLLYNGKAVYLLAGGAMEEDAMEDYYSVEATGKISEELATFSYNEFCFAFDHLYGLKESHNIEHFSNLSNQRGTQDIFTGTHAIDIDYWLYQLIYENLDDLHSKYVMPSYLSGRDAEERYDFGEVIGKGLCWDEFARKRNEYMEIRKKYYPDGIKGYEEIGDVAYITFDAFVTERDLYGRTPENNPDDTLELISYSVSQILRPDSPVKNVVLDLSCNTGGAAESAVYTLGAFLGDTQISVEDPNTGARVTSIYRADTNLDHVFDEIDTLYGKGLNLYCLTSPVSFSCGNLVPCVLKNSGRVTIIGQQSGGGACSVLYLTTAGGSVVRISSSLRLSFLKNGAFYDVDKGAEVDYSINDIEHFYDRKALNEFIHGLF